MGSRRSTCKGIKEKEEEDNHRTGKKACQLYFFIVVCMRRHSIEKKSNNLAIPRNNPTLFALPQASASNNLATRNLTVRQRCGADSYLRMTDCITQSMRQPHFWQTEPNCPIAPGCGQLSRIVSLQYTKGWPATSAATYTCIALLHIFRAHLRCESLLPHRRPDNPNANRPPKKYKT